MTDLRGIPTWFTVTDGAPATTPDYIGQSAYDVTNGIMYVATNTTDPADWKAVAVVPTAKGNLLVASGDGTYGLLSAGSDGQILVYDSAEALGIKAVAPGTATGKKMAKVTGIVGSPSYGNGTSTAKQWDVEELDNDSMVDLGTQDTRITIQTAGVYECIAYSRFQLPVSGNADIALRFRENGSTSFGPQQGIRLTSTEYAYKGTILISSIRDFAEDDYVQVMVVNDSTFSVAHEGSGDEHGFILKEV